MGSTKDFSDSLSGKGSKAGGGEMPAPSVPRHEQKPQQTVRQNKTGDGSDEMYQPGDVIGGKYEVHHRLGKGGFGLVYLVYNRETAGVHAIKTFRDEFLADAAAREMFKKEALLWVKLDEHPFILQAQYVAEFSGRLFVTMEYVAPDSQGRVSLGDHLTRASGPIETDRMLEWAIQFCLGMEHANAYGIKAHRDIKPANILITQDGMLKITDFGLAAAAEMLWSSSRTAGRSLAMGGGGQDFSLSLLQSSGKRVCGTPGYIAPEVWEGKGADVRSDIYAFGLILWQMAAGSPMQPFHAVVPYDSAYAQEYQDAVFRQQKAGRVPRVDSPVMAAIERCLAFEPSERYAAFSDLRADLELIMRKRTGRTVKVPHTGEGTVAFWNNKGVSLTALGRHEEAIRCLDKALEIDPRLARVWSNKGKSFHALGRYEEAIRCYDKALEIDPRLAVTWSNKGGSLNILGHPPEDAIRCYDKAIEIDAGYAYAWNNKGRSLYTLGRHEEAIRCYDKALEIDPRYAAAWHNKGNSLYALSRYEEAIRYLDKALEIDPRDAAAWHNKGNSLHALGRYEEAIRCCDKVLEIDPRYAAAWYNKGSSLHALSRYEDAIFCYDKALEIDPRYAYAWGNKGKSLHALGRHEEAILCCDKVLEIDPRDAAAWHNKAQAENALGRVKDAMRSFRKFIDLAPPQFAVRVAAAREKLQELEGK